MNFGLEQVDQVVERTGVGYQKAKEALLYADGDVLEAIIYLEENQEIKKDVEPELSDDGWEKVEDKVKFGESAASQLGSMGEDVSNFFKDIIRQGTVNRIAVSKDGKTIVDLPVTAGAVGAVFFAPATIISLIAALATGCELQIIKEDGEVINVKDMTKETLEQVKDKMNIKKSGEEESVEEANEDLAEKVSDAAEEFVEESVESKFDDEYEEVKQTEEKPE